MLSIFRVFVLAIYFLKHQILVDYDVSGNKTIISGFGLVHVSDLSDHGYPGQHHRKGCGVALEKHAVCRNRELFCEQTKTPSSRIWNIFLRFFRFWPKEGIRPGTLSGGEQPMLAISRALMARPKLLLLDEPSLGLAPLVVKQIFEIIRKINKENNTTIFLVEQNANLALKVAHRGYVMENGRITLSDFAAKLLVNKEVKRAYLGM